MNISEQEFEQLKTRRKVATKTNIEKLVEEARSTKKRKEQPEFELQKQVAEYLRLQYPKTLFMSDAVSFLKLTMPQAVRNSQIQNENFRCPDLIIFDALGGYGALFLELKSETPYKKDGTLKKDAHLEAQARILIELRKRGYVAQFVWTFEQAKKLIDDYLKLKPAPVLESEFSR